MDEADIPEELMRENVAKIPLINTTRNESEKSTVASDEAELMVPKLSIRKPSLQKNFSQLIKNRLTKKASVKMIYKSKPTQQHESMHS